MGKIKNCEWCGKEFEDKHRDGKRFCNRHCSGFYNASRRIPVDQTGDKNPNWKGVSNTPCDNCGKPIGKAISNRGIKKHNYCSRKCYGEMQTKLNNVTIFCRVCGISFVVPKHDNVKRKFCSIRCASLDPEGLKRKSRLHKGKTIPEWHRQAVSKALSERIAEKGFSSGKNGHYDSSKAGSVFYRSSYELIGFKLLDSDCDVMSYRVEPFVIKYLNRDGMIRRYRPDVLIEKSDASTVLIEIKPQWQLSVDKVKLKLAAGKQYAEQRGWSFEVWTEKELGIKKE